MPITAARTEYHRFAALLDGLADEDWARPTVCPPWDVRRLVAHVLGATEANASPAEMLRQLRRGRRRLAIEVDPVSAAQVTARAHLPPAGLRERYRAAVPAALAWRRRWSRLAGWIPLRVGAPVHETWVLRYLMDTIYTRDVWLHRDDVCRATGHAMILTPEHDGRIVAGVVADWTRRHGRPYRLTLHGPAGGTFAAGRGGPELAFDAVEFCRLLSGRPGTDRDDRDGGDGGDGGDGTAAVPLATPVPF
jgi:uncharacterized protein (TIGR03083 family)